MLKLKNKKGFLKLNNKGLSMVELIVVIAIMAVMLGGAGISMSMLSSAEAKRMANNFIAQVNDVKTGTMTKADEVLIIRYIEVTDANKDALVLEGISKSGYYADKCIYTIMNEAMTTTGISEPYTDKHEYAYMGAGRVGILVDGNVIDKSKAIRIDFNRKTGAIDLFEVGDFDDANVSLSSVDYSDISSIKFQCGIGEYEIEATKETGRFVLK